MSDAELVRRIVGFLRELGLVVVEEPLAGPTFLPGLAIRGGALAYDPSRLAHPGDLLHEAGHLAVLDPAVRAVADAGTLEGHEELEVAAIAWSYAAVLHLGLPPETVFHSKGYQGRGAGLLLTFSAGVYPGLPVMEALGMAASPRNASQRGVPAFPVMLRWLRA